MKKNIPFVKVTFGDEEKAAVLQALDSGSIGGNGPISARFEEYLEERFQVKHALLTTSCSHALELGAMTLRIQPGDEVILPSFTFVTTASAIVRQGARPVFVDIDEQTWNLDPQLVERCINSKTRAIIPVHYAGQGCKMEAIMQIASREGLFVMEDAAQGISALYNQKYLGTIGDIGCLSFHITKNVVCGEGGAFLTNDDVLARRAEIIREKGTNRSQFLRGEVDKYTWVDLGSSFVPSDLLAAVAIVQLGKMDELHQRRRVVWEKFQNGLRDLEKSGDIILPYVASNAQINWHLYAFRTADMKRRDQTIAELKRLGIGATFHYIPLHSSPYAQAQWGYRVEELPITERVSASLIRLPIYPDLTEDDVSYIIDSVHQVLR